MKKGKWIIVILIVILLIILIVLSINNPNSLFGKKSVPLWEFDSYKKVALEEIQSISIETYTESGVRTEVLQYPNGIKAIYEDLSKLKIGRETTSACDDNTVIYTLDMKKGEDVTIEIECDWFVLKDKRYEIEK